MAKPATTPTRRAKKKPPRAATPVPVGGPGVPARDRELRARGQQTMRRLLDAGVTVFSTKGFHAARVDDIVKVAKTSHGTFYLYFANKEDLFEALLADVGDRLTALTSALEPIGPDEHGRQVLHTWIGQFCDIYATYGAIIRTWTEAEVDETPMGRLGADVLGDLADALGAHLVDLPADTDPALAGLALIAVVERLNYFSHTGQVRAERAQVVDLLADVTHASLFGRNH